VLSLVYKGKATQHLIAPNDDGILCVNKKPYGGQVKAIEPLVAALATKPAGWPVKLKEFIDVSSSKVTPFGGAPGGGGGGGGGGGSSTGASVKKKGKASVKKKLPSWLHGAGTKEEADAALAGMNDGSYFVRRRAGKTTEFVLAVVYKGKPSHHLINKVDGSYQINKKYGARFSTEIYTRGCH
jgi:hypothetical protein